MPRASRPQTPYMDAADSLIRRIDQTIPPEFTGEITAVLVGGAAVHVYTQSRVSKDVDIRFSHRLIVPPNLVAVYEMAGEERAVKFDYNYMEEIALLHPDCWDEAWEGWKIGRINVKIISPTDLCVSKIGRWAGNDRLDLCALAAAGLVAPDAVAERCKEALEYYVGDPTMLRYNLRDALELIDECLPPTPP